MKKFKEWLSDYLRYLILAVIIILVIAAAILGINIWATSVGNQPSSRVETEQDTEKPLTVVRETDTETEKTTGDDETEKQTEDGVETETNEVTNAQGETEQEETDQETTKRPEPPAPEMTEAETEAQTEVQTEPPETEPPAPVYKTLIGTCYLRSQPSYDGAILGSYTTGTTVEYLGIVNGWYKVEVNGNIGYMGPRFFAD